MLCRRYIYVALWRKTYVYYVFVKNDRMYIISLWRMTECILFLCEEWQNVYYFICEEWQNVYYFFVKNDRMYIISLRRMTEYILFLCEEWQNVYYFICEEWPNVYYFFVKNDRMYIIYLWRMTECILFLCQEWQNVYISFMNVAMFCQCQTFYVEYDYTLNTCSFRPYVNIPPPYDTFITPHDTSSGHLLSFRLG